MLEWDYGKDKEDLYVLDIEAANCIHDLPLTIYCGDCYDEWGDEWLRLVPIMVDPNTYKEDLKLPEEEVVE